MRGHAIGRKIRAPGEESVTRYLTWPQNLEDKLRATAKRRAMPVTDLVREYIAAGIEKDAAPSKETPPAITFEEAWAEMERKGFQYGHDALEQVRLGWEMRQPGGWRRREPTT